MADVFLTYAREDHAAAQRLATALERLGLTVWLDRGGPESGPWPVTHARELRRAGAVLALWSRASASSPLALAEAREAADTDRLTGVMLEEADPLDGPPAPFAEAGGETINAETAEESAIEALAARIRAAIEAGRARAEADTPPDDLAQADADDRANAFMRAAFEDPNARWAPVMAEEPGGFAERMREAFEAGVRSLAGADDPRLRALLTPLADPRARLFAINRLEDITADHDNAAAWRRVLGAVAFAFYPWRALAAFAAAEATPKELDALVAPARFGDLRALRTGRAAHAARGSAASRLAASRGRRDLAGVWGWVVLLAALIGGGSLVYSQLGRDDFATLADLFGSRGEIEIAANELEPDGPPASPPDPAELSDGGEDGAPVEEAPETDTPPENVLAEVDLAEPPTEVVDAGEADEGDAAPRVLAENASDAVIEPTLIGDVAPVAADVAADDAADDAATRALTPAEQDDAARETEADIAETVETAVETPTEPAVEETPEPSEPPEVEETVVEEPAVEEPVVEAALVEEPAVEEPVVEEPAAEEPPVEEAPVVEEAVVEVASAPRSVETTPNIGPSTGPSTALSAGPPGLALPIPASMARRCRRAVGADYQVAADDTLWWIAEGHYGDGCGFVYPVIYRCNEDLLAPEDANGRRRQRGPDWIYPGDDLRLPPYPGTDATGRTCPQPTAEAD